MTEPLLIAGGTVGVLIMFYRQLKPLLKAVGKLLSFLLVAVVAIYAIGGIVGILWFGWKQF